MKESIQNTKQLARTIQESGRNQRVGFVDNRKNDVQLKSNNDTTIQRIINDYTQSPIPEEQLEWYFPNQMDDDETREIILNMSRNASVYSINKVFTILSAPDDTPATIAAPTGYNLVFNSIETLSAYLSDPNDHNPTGVPLDHIIEAAHGIKSKIHRSTKMSGNSQSTYVHPNDDELYTFSVQGDHTDEIPKITIHEKGKVRAGKHEFE